jgi:four helix bundle protein
MERQAARVFSDLLVWQKSHQFVLAVYKFTERFPVSEVYGLTSQLRRAAVSIAANIAEGFKRRGQLDKGKFLNISQASAEECRYYLNSRTRFELRKHSRVNGSFGGGKQAPGCLLEFCS